MFILLINLNLCVNNKAKQRILIVYLIIIVFNKLNLFYFKILILFLKSVITFWYTCIKTNEKPTK